MGMAVYAKTRERTLVEMLHDYVMSISYNRLLDISAHLGDATVTKYMGDGVVCPPALRKGLFTTAFQLWGTASAGTLWAREGKICIRAT